MSEGKYSTVLFDSLIFSPPKCLANGIIIGSISLLTMHQHHIWSNSSLTQNLLKWDFKANGNKLISEFIKVVLSFLWLGSSTSSFLKLHITEKIELFWSSNTKQSKITTLLTRFFINDWQFFKLKEMEWTNRLGFQ